MVRGQDNHWADGGGFGSRGARPGRHRCARPLWPCRGDNAAGDRREDHVPAAASAHRAGLSCVDGSKHKWRVTRKLRVGIPLNQALAIGAYVLRQHLQGRKRYPLVLMLEPLFRCNLACAGCGKIDYPDKILNQRLSVADCMQAIDECGAPVVVLAGGEPLLHRELPEIVAGALAKGKFVTVCTNALLMDKKLRQYRPHRRFNWSVHL